MPTSAELFAEARSLHAEAKAADAAYTAALQALYGKNASEIRYRPHLQAKHVQTLRDAFVAASEKWGPLYIDACRLQRAEEAARSS